MRDREGTRSRPQKDRRVRTFRLFRLVQFSGLFIIVFGLLGASQRGLPERQTNNESDVARRESAIRGSLPRIEAQKRTDPEGYITAMLAYSEALHVLNRAPSEMESWNALFRVADYVRMARRDPDRALRIYRMASSRKGFSGVLLNDMVGDIEEFDRHDAARALEAYARLRGAVAESAPLTDSRYRLVTKWRLRALDHEIRFLRTGEVFRSRVSREEAAGFAAYLFFFGGSAVANGYIDVELNPYSLPQDRALMQRRLMTVPGSHNSFLKLYTLAAHMPERETLLAWLDRNDPGGYWKCSLLTLFGEDPAKAGKGSLRSVVYEENGSLSTLAVAARQWSSEHP